MPLQPSHFSIAHANVRSILNKRDEISLLLYKQQYEILLITETSLDDSITSAALDVECSL